jgi:3',5'-cyclic AMP phosphodiesterase CpdA
LVSRTQSAAIVQIGDLHLGADWVDRDPSRSLGRCIDAIGRLDLRIAGVLILGDIAEHAADVEYRDAWVQLRGIDAPIHVAMGNQDDRERVRHHFGFAPEGDVALNYSVDIGPFRVLVLDTSVPGSDAGHLEERTLRWLDNELSAELTASTLLAMHHPPVLTGSPAWDQIALDGESRSSLASKLVEHQQIRAILCGHLHRPLLTEFVGRPVLVSPSTYVQFPLRLAATILEPDHEPPGYLVHVITGDGRLVSSFETVS